MRCKKIILMIGILTISSFSCTKANNELPKNSTSRKDLKNQNFCTQEVNSIGVEVPTPITLADKRTEKMNTFMSLEKTKMRLQKYGIYDYFKDDFKDISEFNDGYSYHKLLNDNYIGIHMYSNGLNEIALQKIVYELHHKKEDYKLLMQEKQEILTLINIVTDNPTKSEQILSELEQIYQQKLDKKEFIARNIVVANVEYQGRLFELMGIYSINPKNPKCQENRLTSFSVT
ncbi:Uncharacterised protein [Moraxella lacunata]|uniref:Lipoprotein n=2 Tax=Moraxella lacunata TaxID=477 RepID=A0A378QJN8_MORLA|nr:Uncharacterised protein [Moraxella lacunata]